MCTVKNIRNLEICKFTETVFSVKSFQLKEYQLTQIIIMIKVFLFSNMHFILTELNILLNVVNAIRLLLLTEIFPLFYGNF